MHKPKIHTSMGHHIICNDFDVRISVLLVHSVYKDSFHFFFKVMQLLRSSFIRRSRRTWLRKSKVVEREVYWDDANYKRAINSLAKWSCTTISVVSWIGESSTKDWIYQKYHKPSTKRGRNTCSVGIRETWWILWSIVKDWLQNLYLTNENWGQPNLLRVYYLPLEVWIRWSVDHFQLRWETFFPLFLRQGSFKT